MDFFNGFGKKVSSVMRSVTEKSKDGDEALRLSGEIRSANTALAKRFSELGKASYDLAMGGGDPVMADDLVCQINDLKAHIAELNQRKDEVNRMKRCPNCGAAQPREARFCAACGKRFPEDGPDLDPQPDPDAAFCPECGAAMPKDGRFCAVCGKSLAPAEEDERQPEPGGADEAVPPAPETEEPDAEEPDDENRN